VTGESTAISTGADSARPGFLRESAGEPSRFPVNTHKANAPNTRAGVKRIFSRDRGDEGGVLRRVTAMNGICLLIVAHRRPPGEKLDFNSDQETKTMQSPARNQVH
jgi:hypothetical protein